MPRDTPADPQPTPAEPRATPYQVARQRALELAKAQATDTEIAAVLRSELATTRPKAVMVASEIDRRVRQWADDGLLDDSRTAGRMVALQRLVELAEDAEPKVSAQAAIFLARYQAEPAAKPLRDLARKLSTMDAEELQAYLADLASGVRG